MVSFSEPNGFLTRGLRTQPHLRNLQEVQGEIFRQLQLLIPDEFPFHDNLKSKVAGSPVLRMRVIERHAYTTFFYLTYEFSAAMDTRFAPNAYIRFYHDAKLAEATSFDLAQACLRDTHPAYPSRQMIQRAWRKNRALERWLDYLLKQGHSMVTMLPAGQDRQEARGLGTAVTVG